MPEIITVGETMACMTPQSQGPLRYVHNYELHAAGAESNLAIGVCKMGHTAGWISRIGNDEMGHFVLNSIRAEGVDTSHVTVDPDHRTGLMLKQTGASETKVFYYRENSAASCLSPADLDETYLKNARIIHLTGITLCLSESCEELLHKIKSLINHWYQTPCDSSDRCQTPGMEILSEDPSPLNRCPTDEAGAQTPEVLLSFDPNIRRKLWNNRDYVPVLKDFLYSCQIALLGKDEAETILGLSDPKAILSDLHAHGVRLIALKDGANGAFVSNGSDSFFIPPYPCKVVDPIGAGDAFNAGFLCGYLEGLDLQTCGKMGAMAGALATETKGDIEGYPSKEELLARLSDEKTIYR